MTTSQDFVDMCTICKQGVSRADMEYQKGKVFHSHCFTEHGNTITQVDPDLAHLSARTRIELVQMKNLKVRSDMGKQSSAAKPKPAKKKKQAPKKKPAKKKAKKSKRKKARSGKNVAKKRR